MLASLIYLVAGFGWFHTISGWFRLVSGGFSSFRVVSARFGSFQVLVYTILQFCLGNLIKDANVVIM